ncbi:MAG: 30S ribosomal protein S20 [bacterium]|nr:30S ribosomal protein S20 [bacterium]
MPVIKSAIKKMRQDNKRRQANRLRKERVKAVIKTARRQPTDKNIRTAISLIDRLTKSDLVHRNKAARLKSQVSRLLVKSGKGAQEGKASVTKKKSRSPKGKKAKKSNPS